VRRFQSALLLAVLCSSSAWAQEVVLDKQASAGSLTVLPSVNAPNDYYYIADRASLATGETGLPQFSFLQYVIGNSVADADTREAAGGGVVHALMELKVPPAMIDDARRDLRRINPNGRIVGPVPYQSGKFALISSAADAGTSGGFSDKVLGVGTAPIFENEKAAISIRLNRLGAQVLRESFNSPTPDVSFSFEMQVDGYRSPKRALLVADFDRVYRSDIFQAGIAATYLQAEIEAAFDSLRRTGAIQLTEIGDDQEQAALIKTAYDKLIEIMFEKAPSSGSDALALAAGSNGGSQNMLDRASNLLETRRKETRDDNKEIRERNKAQEDKNSAAAESQSTADDLEREQGNDQTAAENFRKLAQRSRDAAQQFRQKASAAGVNAADKTTWDTLAEAQEQQASKYDQYAADASQRASQRAAKLQDARAKAARDNANVRPVEEEKSMPGIAVVASYKLKESHQSGTFRFDFNKYAASSKTFQFVENIGDLRRYMGDNQVFRTVDLGSSAYQQREVPVFLDAEDLSSFHNAINFVTVSLQRQHDDGQVSTDEIRVDRGNFQQSANNFKLSYRKLNDSGTRWLNYKYKVDWSAFGGAQFEDPWKNSAVSGITLSMPVVARTVQLEADQAKIAARGVRAINFKLYYKIGGTEKSKELNLLTSRPDGLSQKLDFVVPRGMDEYEYSIDWTLANNQHVVTPRRASTASFIQIDELPTP